MTNCLSAVQVSLDGIPGLSMDGIPGVDALMSPMASIKEIISNLPKLDEFGKEAGTTLFQENFMGGKLDIQKGHSQNFATTHNLQLKGPGDDPSSYTFGCNFFDSKLLMMAQVTDGKDVNGTVRYEFSKRLSAMFRSQFENGGEAERINLAPYVFGSKGSLGTGAMDFCERYRHRPHTLSRSLRVSPRGGC
jgi:hypothetical protein